MAKFDKDFSNWTLYRHCELLLFHLESHGDTLDEMLENAIMSLQTWHGEEGPDWTIYDLPTDDFEQVELLFKICLMDAGQLQPE